MAELPFPIHESAQEPPPFATMGNNLLSEDQARSEDVDVTPSASDVGTIDRAPVVSRTVCKVLGQAPSNELAKRHTAIGKRHLHIARHLCGVQPVSTSSASKTGCSKAFSAALRANTICTNVSLFCAGEQKQALPQSLTTELLRGCREVRSALEEVDEEESCWRQRAEVCESAAMLCMCVSRASARESRLRLGPRIPGPSTCGASRSATAVIDLMGKIVKEARGLVAFLITDEERKTPMDEQNNNALPPMLPVILRGIAADLDAATKQRLADVQFQTLRRRLHSHWSGRPVLSWLTRGERATFCLVSCFWHDFAMARSASRGQASRGATKSQHHAGSSRAGVVEKQRPRTIPGRPEEFSSTWPVESRHCDSAPALSRNTSAPVTKVSGSTPTVATEAGASTEVPPAGPAARACKFRHSSENVFQEWLDNQTVLHPNERRFKNQARSMASDDRLLGVYKRVMSMRLKESSVEYRDMAPAHAFENAKYYNDRVFAMWGQSVSLSSSPSFREEERWQAPLELRRLRDGLQDVQTKEVSTLSSGEQVQIARAVGSKASEKARPALTKQFTNYSEVRRSVRACYLDANKFTKLGSFVP